MAHELADGILAGHVETLRTVYRDRRDAMVNALDCYLPNGTHFTVPKGGMFVWLTLPPGLDAKPFLAKALSEEKLAFVPGAAFHARGGGENTVRLSFATCPPEIIEDGMKRLAALIAKEHLAAAA